jgi:hypothetical protein
LRTAVELGGLPLIAAKNDANEVKDDRPDRVDVSYLGYIIIVKRDVELSLLWTDARQLICMYSILLTRRYYGKYIRRVKP